MHNGSSSVSEFNSEAKIAYFSMEIGILNEVRTYSGGLGVLAGDTIRSAADLKLPMVGVTLVTRKGYFTQELDHEGNQIEKPAEWEPAKFMRLLPVKVYVEIEGRQVAVQAWLYVQKSVTGGKVPLFFLDTDLEENSKEDRGITDYLYGGDTLYRLKQEAVLGIGGVRILKELGIEVKKYHMNEGHASFLTLELLWDHKRDIESVWDEDLVWDVDKVRDLCVFTTHTPVAAGHDQFEHEMVSRVLGSVVLPPHIMKKLGGDQKLNMTLLGLNLSEYVNGVAKKHRDVSRNMFPGYEISAITNGVHSYTWTCDSMKRLFDKYIPGWANEPEMFVRIGRIPDDELWDAHMEAKRKLIKMVNEDTGAGMSEDVLTFGFARRATAYKRATLIFRDLKRLREVAGGKLQIIYAGKAHPRDMQGKENIRFIHRMVRELGDSIKVIYLKNYDMKLALEMVAGVDVWLNTPQRPHEASGTSGMKASHNGVVNFSVLDGWWIEGHIEGYTGWAIGSAPTETSLELSADEQDAADLYNKLQNEIVPTYYDNRRIWVRMMQNAIGKNAYYFNTHRMMRRYVTEAYIR